MRLRTRGIQGQKSLKFLLGFPWVIGCPQRAGVGRAQVGTFGIEFDGAVEPMERFLCSAFPRIHVRQPCPVVRIVGGGGEDLAVFLFSFGERT